MIVTSAPAIIPNPQEPVKPVEILPKAETRRPTEPVSQPDASVQHPIRNDEDKEDPQQDSTTDAEASTLNNEDVYTDPRIANLYREITTAGSYVDEYA